MKITAKMLDTRTGVERSWIYDVEEEYLGSQKFLWTEGNYSCDCNRSLFFYNWDPHQSLPCNVDDNMITLVDLTREDGTSLL